MSFVLIYNDSPTAFRSFDHRAGQMFELSVGESYMRKMNRRKARIESRVTCVKSSVPSLQQPGAPCS